MSALTLAAVWSLAGAACKSGTEAHIRPCTAADDSVVLALAEYQSIDPAIAAGCVVFPAALDGAEYLLVPQITTSVTGAKAAFRLGGDTILSPPPPSAPAGQATAEMSDADRFHTYLRLGDERRWWGFDPALPPPQTSPGIEQSSTAGPPAFNSRRVFQVCARVDCTRFDRVVGRARAVKTNVAIYVDSLAPAGGLDSTALDSVASMFEQRLYAIDTAAFGRESDIDSNAVVLILMTNTVNKLVTTSQCTSSGFIAGFFYGLDLDPRYRTDTRSNKGEVFYSIVADPSATLSCSHTANDVQAIVPVTFIHEFQHMISFNQHVLVRGSLNGELLWLNEGLSHYAEELGGRSYETTATVRVSDCIIGTITCRFYGGNLHNAYSYLDSTSRYSLEPTSGVGSLAERGAAWLFVRYVVDRYSNGSTLADWYALTRSMVGTANVGAANIAAVTGDPFTTVASRWALANWVSDLPAFSAPAELRYDSWSFRSTFASLNSQRGDIFPKPYPLVPTVSAGKDVSLSGTLRAGSGIYHRATQSFGSAGFTLSFSAPSGAVINSSFVPRLNVIRIQ